jgi:hypothetical protein
VDTSSQPAAPGAARPGSALATLTARPPRTALPAFAYRLPLPPPPPLRHFGQMPVDSTRNCTLAGSAGGSVWRVARRAGEGLGEALAARRGGRALARPSRRTIESEVV